MKEGYAPGTCVVKGNRWLASEGTAFSFQLSTLLTAES